MATPAGPADPHGCVAALAAEGCDCQWAVAKNHAPLQGLAKAAAGIADGIACPSSGPDVAGCKAASASAAACELFCCKGGPDGNPPLVTSAPTAPLVAVTGPCGQWQWNSNELDGSGGCWVSVDPVLQKLPYHENGNGPWCDIHHE